MRQVLLLVGLLTIGKYGLADPPMSPPDQPTESAVRSPVTATPAQTRTITAVVAREPTGESLTTFTPDTPELYLRWQGESLNGSEKLRCIWIAEDVGRAAPPNYHVNEASTKVAETEAFGTFTLSRPKKGWPLGKYRAEIYLGDNLAATVRFSIMSAEP